MMNEPNLEIKPDESTIRRRVDIACDGEQRSLPPKQLASEEQRRKVINIDISNIESITNCS